MDETEELNKELMSRAPERYTDGVVEGMNFYIIFMKLHSLAFANVVKLNHDFWIDSELGELPTLTLHKLQQQMEDKSGLFYAEERGLARVCNPVGSSYVTARPFRCNPIYRCCEAVHSAYQGSLYQFYPHPSTKTKGEFRIDSYYFEIKINTIFNSFISGHIPGQKFLPGENRANASRNALKHMTYRV